ncbi:MAG: hypothetical protein ABI758_01745 [Candidatus Woesebacteria bacterium]
MLYDITKTFEENIAYGPFWNTDKANLHRTFLGFNIHSPFGVAACPLTVNSRFILFLSTLGYDIFTYKSVRSLEWRGNAFPHWQYVDIKGEFSDPSVLPKAQASFTPFDTAETTTMANSFGIQSVKPEYWQEDVGTCVAKLPEGKLLILSLMCTPQPGESLIEDAKRLALLANETTAHIFELNLACPNTDGGQGLIYEDIEISLRLCGEVKNIIGDKQLLVKVGYYQNQQALKTFLKQAKGIISGISSTNTYSMSIVTKDGKEAFPNRPTAGVSGSAVRGLSLKQAKNAVKFSQELEMENFVIIGIGGVTKPEHIDQYLALGVDAVQSAVGVFANPHLAMHWKNS